MLCQNFKFLLTGFIVILTVSNSKAQDSVRKKHISYIATVHQLNNQSLKGYVHSADSTAIDFSQYSGLSQKIPVANIDYLSFRRRNSIGRGAWIGALIGLGAGVITGLASGSDKKYPYVNDGTLGGAISDAFTIVGNAFAMTAGEKAVVGGLLGATAGSAVGIIIGAVAKKKFIIKGSSEHYREQREKLLKYLHE